LVGATRCLAIDRNHPGRHADEVCYPGDEAALERLGIERGEDIAEMIVGGSAVAKRLEPAKQTELLLAEPRDIHERLRPGQHRQQAQQHHLSKRIHHLRTLPRVRQILEIPQKHNRFAERSAIRRRARHRRPPLLQSEDNHRFSTSAVCHALPSPDCPGVKPRDR
jgi:hypothetical protein